MGLEAVLWQIVLLVVQMLFGFLAGMFAIREGIQLFYRLTEKIDEWKEMKKGNVAVAIVLVAVILSMANVIQPGVLKLTASLEGGRSIIGLFVGFLLGLLNLAIGIAAAIAVIYVALRVLDKVTEDINIQKELKNGNVAVALFVAGVLLALSTVVSGAVGGLASVFSALVESSVRLIVGY